jgi:hypothetical protein
MDISQIRGCSKTGIELTRWVQRQNRTLEVGKGFKG